MTDANLVIVTTHPIQYQVPLWQALASHGGVEFEVWFLTHHGVVPGRDLEFDKIFSWDLDLLSGYRNRKLRVPPTATPNSFFGCRLAEPLVPLLRQVGARAVWI